MSVELITGYSGEPHISSADDGARNIGTFGSGKYVLPTGTELSCSIQGANTAVIGAGDVLFEGRHVRITGTNEVALDNGAQGINRNDIVCLYYSRDTSTTVEAVTLVVLKGTGTSGTPVDPTIPSGSIAAGANEAYMALWRIPISGITPGTPVKLYGDVLPDMHDLATRTLPADQVPNISASKITSGTLAIARGGTGASTFNPHAVLIGPSSGSSAAAPTKRALVAADLPSSITSSTSGNAATSTSATKLATARSLYVALGSTYDSSNPVTFDGSANKALPVSGTLPVARGGTGLTAAPSMLVNLASTSAANVMTASPRPGVSGLLPVGHGGTGKTTLTANAVLIGNGSSAINSVSTTSGAFYATSTNGAPVFGKLPIAQGGTNAVTAAQARTNLGAQADPTVLFNYASGKRDQISVDNILNYMHLKVYYSFNEKPNIAVSDRGYCEIYGASSGYTIACAAGHDIDATHAQLSVGYVTVYTDSLYVGSRSYINFTNGASPEVGRDAKFWVYRVEGWN